MQLIESITIRYFRSVYTLSLSKCSDMTIITGKNDAGKSNILKALNLFFNQQSDYRQAFSFFDDYSIKRREEVRKDTVRGQQFISISIKFLRGDRMPNSLPPTFTVTKRWDMHSTECKISNDAHQKMQIEAKKRGIKYSEKITTTSLSTFLNRIKYIYIPAIKDTHVFSETLDLLQQNLFRSKNREILDAPISSANDAVQLIMFDLQDDFRKATGIENFVQIPTTLNYTNGLLQVNTQTSGGSVTIDKRGDGIRSHFIPKILNYLARDSSCSYIWGFEEPENSYEYRRCIQVADEFINEYSKHSQIFITTHSPAFIHLQDKAATFCVGNRDGKTELIQTGSPLDEELGYIELYRHFVEQVRQMEKADEKKNAEIEQLRNKIHASAVPIILTEGKTDASLLRLAIERLGLTKYSDCIIQPIKSEQTSNNDVLLRFLTELRDNMKPSMPIIGMFDRDTRLSLVIDKTTIDIRDTEFQRIADNVYAFAIPVPHERKEIDQISIEHYFTDSEIKTEIDGKRLFIGNEFFPTGVYKGDEEYYFKGAAKVHNTIKIIEHESKCYVTKTDGTGDYSLSKALFVECIEKRKQGFENISFEEFRLIFSVLDEIMNDVGH